MSWEILQIIKEPANKLQKIEGINLVIALVPDGMEEDGPYNPFKTIWAKANIPSQMISMKTAKLFAEEAKEGNKAKIIQDIIFTI